ncbi:glutamate-5-semialdehyde dehydrogenase [Iodidimonas sp. SYSU 1G8]|uniref:glutamate-5-semialdehyde dehydrogenase n=1 Tax=Iodidimonas sp. SYSU 1G8 TaxID=3133967 RepID=UPI0031FE4A2A
MTVAEMRTPATDIAAIMKALGDAAKAAARLLSTAPTEAKNAALRHAAQAVRDRADEILAANARDLASARERGLGHALLDRLTLTPDRVAGMAKGLDEVAALADPVGAVMDEWDRPNGLRIARVRVPLGVIGIIYESRPNVTADAGALALKAGNAAILRGGSEAVNSNRAIMECLAEGLDKAGLPAASIQLVPTQDRDAVGIMLRMADTIDVIVPRGGRSLVERVQNEARIPVFAHLDGICHTYVHEAADLAKARAIVVNGKMRRTGVCGATECLLIDRKVAGTHLKPIVEDLIAKGCEVRGDADARAVDSRIVPATDADWGTEFLDAIIAVRVVDGIDEAMDHIARYGSSHTESIVTEDRRAAERFLAEVGSAIVLHNASTQFADGGEFGMGAEIGISTGKMHARGPVGVEQLTIFKYVVRGDGQIRP